MNWERRLVFLIIDVYNADAMKPLNIGNLSISMPVVLAPLAGYSDLAFRRICREMGAGYCSSEMILDRSVTCRRKKPLAALVTADDDRPVAGQIIGNDPEAIVAAAVRLENTGFDVVDLNFACPVNKALKKRRGGYLMKQPETALKIVRSVLGTVKIPVTVKLRKSFVTGECTDNFYRIARGCRDAGVAAIAVHGRAVQQKYTGSADWDFISEVASEFSGVPVIGSGDVFRPEDALDMLERTGVDGVLVARGAIGNPWFFRHVRDLLEGREPRYPGPEEQRRVMEKHFREAVGLYGAERASKMMRKFGIKYSRLHPEPKQLRMAFVAVKNESEWRNVMEKYYPV